MAKINPDTMRQLWDAAGTMDYPARQLVQLLLDTGRRPREVAHAEWSEFNLDAAIWVIPASRMKDGRACEIALSPRAIEIIRSIPRRDGKYLFGGSRPFNALSLLKAKLVAQAGLVKSFTLYDLSRVGKAS